MPDLLKGVTILSLWLDYTTLSFMACQLSCSVYNSSRVAKPHVNDMVTLRNVCIVFEDFAINLKFELNVFRFVC